MTMPTPLRAGDRVALAATARKVSPDEIAPFVQLLEGQGYDVLLPDGLFASDNQMAGTDEHRAAFLQSLLDDGSVRAIFCARGGYGTVRIVDRLDFNRFMQSPKWIVGYSDATVLHSCLNRLGCCSLHATMPIDITTQADFASMAATSMLDALAGRNTDCTVEPHNLNRPGYAEAEVVGGNLSILYSLSGTPTAPDTRGKILLIEDLDEYLYHIDRMMLNLRRSGALSEIKGLIVGGMTDMHDNTVPFGLTAEEIVLRAVADYNYPVLFGAPYGHIKTANRAIVLGKKIALKVAKTEKSCIFAL
ncbi:MAG: LD-carboxypeptidase [Bacteroidales bacterium]|nr:LD-carboxypeptidase [Bacteroidales bacterium]